MPFKAWGFWSKFMLAVMLLVALGVLIGPFFAPTAQVITVAIASSAGAFYIAWRYWQGRQRLKREHVEYLRSWKVNVFCIDESTRARWNFGTQALIEAALREVSERMKWQRVGNLDIRLVSEPFPYRGLPGLCRGVWDPNRSTVTLAWFEGEDAPAAAHHEFAHVVLSRRDGIDDSEHAHIEMKALGLPW